jgi:hypothetical protein
VERLDIVFAKTLEPGGRQPHVRPEALDQGRLELRGVGDLLQRARRLVAREDFGDIAIGKPPLPPRLADVLEPVAPLAQPRDDARVGHRRDGPSARTVDLGDDAALGPAAQGRGGNPDTPSGFSERKRCIHESSLSRARKPSLARKRPEGLLGKPRADDTARRRLEASLVRDGRRSRVVLRRRRAGIAARLVGRWRPRRPPDP